MAFLVPYPLARLPTRGFVRAVIAPPSATISELTPTGDGGWVAAIARLVEDGAERERLGKAGRTTVIERYTGQRWASRFLEVLMEAADTRLL